MDFIIKWKPKHGNRRSVIERNLAKEGWGTSLDGEQLEKCAYMENKAKEKFGLEKSHMRTTNINKVGKGYVHWLDKK